MSDDPPNDAPAPPNLTSHAKGKALEDAVRIIEETVLRMAPAGASMSQLRIEPRKVVVVAGVRHEIDLFVQFRAAPGYECTFIFECKNWAEKVGKNEVIVFSEKVKVTGAQRGFLVAQGFTKDAKAQSASDTRVELVEASVDITSPFTGPPFFVGCTFNELKSVDAHVAMPMAVGEEVDVMAAPATLDGVAVEIGALAKEWAAEEIKRQHEAAIGEWIDLPSGTHSMRITATRAFDAGRLVIAGRSVPRIDLEVGFDVYRSRPLYVVDVKGRGRVEHVETPLPGGGALVVRMITTVRRTDGSPDEVVLQARADDSQD